MIQTQAPINNLYIGIMSGTSVDAIDIVAIRIEDNHFSFVGGVNFEFPNHLRTKILEITRQEKAQDSKIIAQLDSELGCEYANAVNQLLRTYKIKKEKVTAIGLHGQTIAHDPNAAIPKSVQIGDAKLVAQKTGIICVADFRSADINAGGQGAPLAPVFHSWLFRIATNNCIDFIRKKKLDTTSIHSTYTDDNGEDVGIDLKDSRLNPQELAIKNQKIQIMRDFVKQLPPKYQILVELRYFKEYSYDEISKELESPLGTIKAQLHRARELLQELVKHKRDRI